VLQAPLSSLSSVSRATDPAAAPTAATATATSTAAAEAAAAAAAAAAEAQLSLLSPQLTSDADAFEVSRSDDALALEFERLIVGAGSIPASSSSRSLPQDGLGELTHFELNLESRFCLGDLDEWGSEAEGGWLWDHIK